MTSYKQDKEQYTNEDPVGHAHSLYKKCFYHSVDLESNVKAELADTIYKILRRNLKEQHVKRIFRFSSFQKVIEETILSDRFEAEKSAKAFLELEKYFKLLYISPWKTEFWTLKLYSGFFNSKIKSHLKNPEEIFYIIGYKKVKDDELVLQEKLDRFQILDLCFECLVAAVECATISDLHNEIKHKGGDIKDALEWRTTGKMPSEELLIAKLKSSQLYHNHDPSSYYGSEQRQPGQNIDERDYERLYVDVNPSKGKVNKIYYEEEKEIPFMDDNDVASQYNYPEATHDEHLQASMREVKIKDNEKGAGLYENGLPYTSRSLHISKERQDLDLKSLPSPKEDKIFVNGREGRRYYPSLKSQSKIVSHAPIPILDPNASHAQLDKDISYLERSDCTIGSQHRKYPVQNNCRLETDGDLYVSDYFDAPSLQTNNAKLPKRSVVKKEWKCVICTTLNDPSVDICKCCHKSKNQGPDLENPKAGDKKIVCTRCTLENSPLAERCIACDEVLQPCNFQTYV